MQEAVLTKSEIQALKHLRNGETWEIDQGYYQRLRKLGYISIPFDEFQHPVFLKAKLTIEGSAELDKINKENRRFWLNEIRGWITTIIAVSAFILSFIAATHK